MKKITLYLSQKALKEFGESLLRTYPPAIVGDKIEFTINSVNGKRNLDIFIIPEEIHWEDMPNFIKKHQK